MFYLDAFGMWNEGFEMSLRWLRWHTYSVGYFYNSSGDSMRIELLLKPLFEVDLHIL